MRSLNTHKYRSCIGSAKTPACPCISPAATPTATSSGTLTATFTVKPHIHTGQATRPHRLSPCAHIGQAVKTATEVGVRAIQDHKVIEWNTCWKCRLLEGTDDM